MADGRETCVWCGQESVGDLILRGETKKRLRQTVPACRDHVRHFNAQGILTVAQSSSERERKRAQTTQQRRDFFRR